MPGRAAAPVSLPRPQVWQEPAWPRRERRFFRRRRPLALNQAPRRVLAVLLAAPAQSLIFPELQPTARPREQTEDRAPVGRPPGLRSAEPRHRAVHFGPAPWECRSSQRVSQGPQMRQRLPRTQSLGRARFFRLLQQELPWLSPRQPPRVPRSQWNPSSTWREPWECSAHLSSKP
jgi:hypothetical protein